MATLQDVEFFSSCSNTWERQNNWYSYCERFNWSLNEKLKADDSCSQIAEEILSYLRGIYVSLSLFFHYASPYAIHSVILASAQF